MTQNLPEVVGSVEAPFCGRIWVRDFGTSMELLYKSGASPGESERLNTWLREAGKPGIGMIRRVGYTEAVADDVPEVDGESDRERAARRARQAVRWKIKAINADRMLTLTHRENITSYEESRAILQRFLAMCRKEWSEWKFVGVPERQERGAWHWHLALAGWVNVDNLRGFWWRAHGRCVTFSSEGSPVLLDGGETPGNVDIKAARKTNRPRRTWQPDRLAGYLAKYMGKGLEDGGEELSGRASYTASRGITYTIRRMVVRGLTFADVASVTFSVLSEAGAVLPFLWQSENRAVLWASSLRDVPPAAAPPADAS